MPSRPVIAAMPNCTNIESAKHRFLTKVTSLLAGDSKRAPTEADALYDLSTKSPSVIVAAMVVIRLGRPNAHAHICRTLGSASIE